MTSKRIIDAVCELTEKSNVQEDDEGHILVSLGPEEYRSFRSGLDELGFGVIEEKRVHLRSNRMRYRLTVIPGMQTVRSKYQVEIPVAVVEVVTASKLIVSADEGLSGAEDARAWIDSQKLEERPGYIYFLTDYLITGLTRIGVSTDYAKRIAWITSETPFEWAKLVHVVDATDCIALEHYYHILYRPFRRHREWFDLPYEMLKDLVEQK